MFRSQPKQLVKEHNKTTQRLLVIRTSNHANNSWFGAETKEILYLALKVHKHEIIKSLYALGKVSKKNSLLFLRFLPEFRSSNIFALTEHTQNQIYLERYPKMFFFKKFT
jgi:hypothetical protein